MIFTNKGQVNASGNTPELMSDLSIIVHALNKEIDKDLLKKAFNDGLMTDKEIEQKAKEFKDKNKEIAENFLRMMFGMDD